MLQAFVRGVEDRGGPAGGGAAVRRGRAGYTNDRWPDTLDVEPSLAATPAT
jgi:hypothetical protein